MQLFKDIESLQRHLKQHSGKTIGFVPTMGALHMGHMALIESANQQADITICSIFVNPIQFNKQNDFDNYPKTLNEDIKQLEAHNCDILFCPSTEEMYPAPVEKEFDFGAMATIMEGEHRPGHFRGVAIVIERFFELIHPDYAYFGEKDFQQLAVVKALTKQLGLSTKIIGVKTMREASGLAMSSRNLRLSEVEKQAAALIYKGLMYIKENQTNQSVQEIKQAYKAMINASEYLETEYIEIADGNTLQIITDWTTSDYVVAFTAVNVGEVRLIDNMTIIS